MIHSSNSNFVLFNALSYVASANLPTSGVFFFSILQNTDRCFYYEQVEGGNVPLESVPSLKVIVSSTCLTRNAVQSSGGEEDECHD